MTYREVGDHPGLMKKLPRKDKVGNLKASRVPEREVSQPLLSCKAAARARLANRVRGSALDRVKSRKKPGAWQPWEKFALMLFVEVNEVTELEISKVQK